MQTDMDLFLLFFNDGMVMFFSKAPLSSMVFQWFCHPLTITIECFFYRSTIEINGFSMVFPNSGAMVSNGFDLERDQQIVTDPILQELCVLFRIQITLLHVNLGVNQP